MINFFLARGTAGVDSASTGGTWDISNADRLGKSEIELVNIFIEGKLGVKLDGHFRGPSRYEKILLTFDN